MAASSINLSVMTPERQIVMDQAVESVIVPGEEGQMNILPEHVSLLTSLKPGTFAYRVSGQWTWAALSGGFAQVTSNRMIVLAETMELAKEIDTARAERAAQKAADALKEHVGGTDAYREALSRKQRAEARLMAAKLQ